MNESSILPILIFNAVISKQKGRVKRFVDELLKGFELEKLPVYRSIWREDAGRTRNFIKLLKSYFELFEGG